METKRIEVVVFIKGLSILTIVLFHLTMRLNIPDYLLKFNPFSGVGVHSFIFVSGFTLYLSYLRRPLKLLSFYKRRFSAVYIPYIFVVIIFVVIFYIIDNSQFSYYSLFGHVLLYKMFDNEIIGSYAYYFWFISTIFQFYFVFPIIVKIKEKVKDLPFILGSLLISLLWSLVVLLLEKEAYRTWNSFFLQYLWEFNLGILLADFYVKKKWKFWEMKTIYLTVIVVVGVFLFVYLPTVFGVKAKLFNDFFGSVAFTSILILVYRIKINLFRELGLLCGIYSYDIYLTHGLVFIVLSLFSFRGIYGTIEYAVFFLVILFVFSMINNLLSGRIIKVFSKYTK